MKNTDLIKEFLELIDKTGLSEDRKEYWVERITSQEFNPEDEAAFEAEISEHIAGLDLDINFLTLESKALKERKEELLTEALPSLTKMSEEAPALMEAELNDYKQGVLEDEKVMMDDIEEVRNEKQTDEIDSIRKMLGSK